MVCFVTRSPSQLIGEVAAAGRCKPLGKPRRYDYEYRREWHYEPDSSSFGRPSRPWRTVKVTEQRTALDLPNACVENLVDKHCIRQQDAVIPMVMDNLVPTHGPGAPYEAFSGAEAHRILQRLDIHPTHAKAYASWLNMVELGIGVRAVSVALTDVSATCKN